MCEDKNTPKLGVNYFRLMKKEKDLSKYRYWQWRNLIALMVGYACFYLLRKNFSAAIPAMEAELGLSKVQLGIFLTLNGIVYGLSRVVNGVLADRGSKRKLMTAGLLLSCVINLAICFSPSLNGVFRLLDGDGKATVALVYLIGSLWVLNGYVQGMGYPPCAAILAHWFSSKELATRQSIWNASHSIGAGLVIALCGWLLSRFGYSAWNLCFIVPAAIAFVGAIAMYATLRDTPADVGLPAIEEAQGSAASKNLSADGQRGFLNYMVFRNPMIWIVCIADFCVYVVRFTILEWGTSFLTQYKGLDISTSANIVAFSELIGGTLGVLIAGFATDRCMKSRTLRTCALCTLASTLFLLLFWRIPSGAHWMWSALPIVLSAMFIYGPQALLGVSCSQYATKRASGTANGFCGIFCYAATIISGIGFGWLADAPGFGWNAVFVVAALFGLAGTLLLASQWKAPADGSARAEKYFKYVNCGK